MELWVMTFCPDDKCEDTVGIFTSIEEAIAALERLENIEHVAVDGCVEEYMYLLAYEYQNAAMWRFFIKKLQANTLEWTFEDYDL